MPVVAVVCKCHGQVLGGGGAAGHPVALEGQRPWEVRGDSSTGTLSPGPVTFILKLTF